MIEVRSSGPTIERIRAGGLLSCNQGSYPPRLGFIPSLNDNKNANADDEHHKSHLSRRNPIMLVSVAWPANGSIFHRSTDMDTSSDIDHLRVVLHCFYFGLGSHSFQYAKQVIVHYPHANVYVSVRGIVGCFCTSFYSLLILYALWAARVAVLAVSIVLLAVLVVVRAVFDIYGYATHSCPYSLYPPFERLREGNQAANTTVPMKPMLEEMTDFSLELLVNSMAVLLACVMLIRRLAEAWNRKQMDIEALRMDVLRRMTV